MKSVEGEFLFVEKYRPQTVDDCILPKGVKKTIKDLIKDGEIQNMIFCASAGTGKCLHYDTKIDVMISEELFAKILSLNNK